MGVASFESERTGSEAVVGLLAAGKRHGTFFAQISLVLDCLCSMSQSSSSTHNPSEIAQDRLSCFLARDEDDIVVCCLNSVLSVFLISQLRAGLTKVRLKVLST